MSIFLINPYILRPKLIRTFFDAGYTVTRATTTSTAFTSRMSLSTTETASTNYATFWQITHDGSATNSDSRVQLFETSARQIQNLEPPDTTDRFAGGGMYAYAGGTAKTFQLQTSAEGGTHGYAGYALNVLQLTAADAFTTNLTNTTTTSNVFSTFISDTFPESGDYVVVGYCELLPTGSSADAQLLYNGTTEYGTQGPNFLQDATNYSPYFYVQRITGVTAGQTIALQRRSVTNATTTAIRGASLLLLKTNQFENFYYAEQPTTQTTTAATYAPELSQTFNILNPSNQHLILASAMMRVNSTTASGRCKLINTTSATDYNVEHDREPNATTEWYPTIVTRIVTFSGSSNTIEWQSRAEIAGTTVDLKNMSIAIFDLGTT